jgi:isopenicillin-N N-acyltransferase like protein
MTGSHRTPSQTSGRRPIFAAMTILFFAICWAGQTGHAQQKFRYPERKFGSAELKYVHEIPVLEVSGSSQEMGAQIGELGAKPGSRAMAYPKDFLRQVQMEFMWPVLVRLAKPLLSNFPEDHLAELEGIATTVQQGRDELIAANTMFDLLRGLGCSTFAVEASRSATGKPMFGRNLDFPTLGYLHEFSLVTIYHPAGKRSFASVGFPGCIGVISGMNDAGLTVAVLEVYESKDGSPKFDHRGTPYALCFRRLLEECATVAEAEKLLRTMNRTTWVNLAVCDTKKAAVFEITPQSVEVRGTIHGTCASTNHFRTNALAKELECWRYPILEELQKASTTPVSLEQLKKALHRVNQDDLTLQTMIFEPVDLRLHLAIGATPSSALPMQTIELRDLLKRKD